MPFSSHRSIPVSSSPPTGLLTNPSGNDRILAAPREPEHSQPHGFPIVAVLAPVLGSVLIWVLTRSPFALVFALLGPLVAIASVVDARIQARRGARRESTRFDAEVTATRISIDRLHDEELTNLLRVAPGAIGLTARSRYDPERWRARAGEGVPLRLGLGTAPSTVHLEGRSLASRTANDPVQIVLDQLENSASVLVGAPILVDARLGVGVCGPGALTHAVARGFLAQLGDRISPEHSILSPEDAVASDWIDQLPHQRTEPRAAAASVRCCVLRWRCSEESGVIAVSSRVEDLPIDCRVVILVATGRAAQLIRCPDAAGLGPLPIPLVAEFVSAEQTAQLGQFLALAAAICGREPAGAAESAQLDFQSLPRAENENENSPRDSLACVFAQASDGGAGVVVDLVAHGPHAIIGGTTGSGKSELLVSWVLAMAQAYPASTVTFLLVDFKGGAAFAPIRSLPQVVGIVTDLDERTAHRAMLSLRAELRYRERVIAGAGARSIDDPGVELPRLVIVVDEFAAMAAEHPQLHELFADLAARGRSLGLHLVLCTQRPAGAIRDSVLANATLRLSLRVNNAADSIAVIGSSKAAELRVDLPGRALICLGSEPVRLVRVARVADEDVRRVAAERIESAPVRRPWCDDLPRSITLNALEIGGALQESGDGIPFALVDLPEQQRQETGCYLPARSGNLLVIGAQGSGKTELIETLSSAEGVETLPTDTDAAWDAVEAALGRVRGGTLGPRLLLADDLDVLAGRFAEEYQATFIDRMIELARGGSAVGLQLGVTLRRIPPALQSLAALCDERVILRLGSRQDHLMAGGSAGGFLIDAPPGAAEWRGRRIQIALSRGSTCGDPVVPSADSALTVDEFDVSGYSAVAVVTTRVAEFSRRLRSVHPRFGEVQVLTTAPRTAALNIVDSGAPSATIGDPDSWQVNWTLLAAIRARGLVLVDHCSIAEFRALSGRRNLPPPIRVGADHCWALEPDGSVRRMVAPSA